MPPAPLPPREAERLAALSEYRILDSACEDSFDNIVRLAARLTGSPIALISLVDKNRQWFKAAHGLDATETPRELAFCAHAILDPANALVVSDATKDSRFADNALVTGSPDIRFYAGVPLVNPEGYALGTLCVIDRQPKELAPDALDTLSILAQAVTTYLELRRAMQSAQATALTDALTGLPNRVAFLDAFNRAVARQRRDGQPFSVLYFDLDHFKQVNDRCGHSTGDRVLAKVAYILQTSVRREDIVARIGGDEFSAVLIGGDGSEAASVAERARSEIEARMTAEGWGVTVSVGGIAFLHPPADFAEALAAVDALMYQAKAAGRNQVLCQDYTADGMMAAVAQA